MEHIVCTKTGRECYGSFDLPLLLEISQMINNHANILEVLNPIVEKIAEYLDAERVLLTILNRKSSSILIEAGFGISEEAQKRGKYKIGEGIIGSVVKSRKPIYVERENGDPRFINKTRSRLVSLDRKDLSFICVPIEVDNEITGTLSIDIKHRDNFNENDMFRLLSIAGSMIARAVKVRQERMEELEKLTQEKEHLQHELRDRFKFHNIIGNSGKMQEVYKLIERVAPMTSTILIRGESGVGKELIADALHYNSSRADFPIVKVNCSALPDNLIESELFGYEKGAFTGAEKQKIGRFEMAEGGTIFLDEIGDLPLPTQVKLLRVLQQKEYERVGGTKSIKTNVRVVTATNRNLEELIKTGEFREDLYYRINVFPIYVPSLKERVSDIPALADHFIRKFNKMNGASIKRISASAIDMLMVYHWPGNIRELENCIEWSAIMSMDGVIRSNNLPPTLQTAQSTNTEAKGSLNNVLDNVERQLLRDALINTKGNMAKAAKILGITERQMGLRVGKYDIDVEKFKFKYRE